MGTTGFDVVVFVEVVASRGSVGLVKQPKQISADSRVDSHEFGLVARAA